MLVVSVFGLLSGRFSATFKKQLGIFFFGIFPIVAFCLLHGGLGLEYVATAKWGGFMLTLIISGIGIVFSLPIGVLLALGRRSRAAGRAYACAWS